MQVTSFGIRVVGTNDLFWGPDHLARFKPWPEGARRFETLAKAEERMAEIVARNRRLNAEYAHLEQQPTDLELVVLTTTVTPVEG